MKPELYNKPLLKVTIEEQNCKGKSFLMEDNFKIVQRLRGGGVGGDDLLGDHPGKRKFGHFV